MGGLSSNAKIIGKLEGELSSDHEALSSMRKKVCNITAANQSPHELMGEGNSAPWRSWAYLKLDVRSLVVMRTFRSEELAKRLP
jgi:hypothetical protein